MTQHIGMQLCGWIEEPLEGITWKVFWWVWPMLSVTHVTCPGPTTGFRHSSSGQCLRLRWHPISHTQLRQQEKGRNKERSPGEEEVPHQCQVKERKPPSWVPLSHPGHSWPWPNYSQCQNKQDKMGSHVGIKNQTEQNQLWSQMIHTWTISALNNAGNPTWEPSLSCLFGPWL